MVPAVLSFRERCRLERARQWYRFSRKVVQTGGTIVLLVLWSLVLAGFVNGGL